MTPAKLHDWMRAAGGRRFLISVGCGIVSTVVLVLGYIGEASYVQLILGTVAAFVAGASWRQDTPPSAHPKLSSKHSEDERE